MVEWAVIKKLMSAFPRSLINQQGEFIAHLEANEYFMLESCETELDIKCKVLEWLSRAAYKTAPFGERKNKTFNQFMLDGINTFLGTSFTSSNMNQIYTYLGNAVNHEKTLRFVNSGYDFSILEEQKP